MASSFQSLTYCPKTKHLHEVRHQPLPPELPPGTSQPTDVHENPGLVGQFLAQGIDEYPFASGLGPAQAKKPARKMRTAVRSLRLNRAT